MHVNSHHIREGIRALGLSGKMVCVHASMGSFGWVTGGAKTVIDGMLDEGCTLLMPTFSWSHYGVPSPRDDIPKRNGMGKVYAEFIFNHRDVYRKDTLDVDRYDMGAISTALVKMPERIRGDHPLCSFSAVGPLANQLVCGQTWANVYEPFRALIEADGYVLLMGVTLQRMTLIHYAEQQAGRNLFLRWANTPDGDVMGVEVGGCSEGFDNFAPILAPYEKRCKVGGSLWRVFPAKETLGAAVTAIQQNPNITHCQHSYCERCHDSVLGGRVIE